MKKRIIIATLLLLAIFGSVFTVDIWRGYQARKMASMFRPPPITVSTLKVTTQDWQDLIQSVGSIVAINSVAVTADIEGKVVEILFQDGDFVKQDQPLIQLDDEIVQQNLKDHTAQLTLNKDNLERSKSLYQKGAIPKSDLDLNESLFIRSQAAVATDQINIKHKKVSAPFSGKIGIKKINIGDYLAPGNPIVDLTSMDPMYVDFLIPERFVSKLKIGQKITLSVDAHPDKSFEGTLKAINSNVDVNTRNMTVRGEIPNPDNLLYSGMFAKVTLYTGAMNKVIAIPRVAITYSTFGDIVYVVEKENNQIIAKQKSVLLGDIRDDWIVVTSGLHKGDEVVTAGQVKLNPNSAVIVNNSDPLNNQNK